MDILSGMNGSPDRGGKKARRRVLLADIGNSTVRFAWRGAIAEDVREIPTPEWLAAPQIPDCDCVYASVVVPDAVKLLREAAGGRDVMVLGEDVEIPLLNATTCPGEVGRDRLAACLAADRNTPGDNVVVCCGTALALSACSQGEFLGGNIIPGPRLQWEALHRGTAQLPPPSGGRFELPRNVLGRNTRAAISKGIAFGLVGALNHLLELYDRILRKPTVYLCGGWAAEVSPHVRREHVLRPHLVLEGVELVSAEVGEGCG